MSTQLASLSTAAYVLLASGPAIVDVDMTSVGTVRLVHATSLPAVGATNFAEMVRYGGAAPAHRGVHLASGENLYGLADRSLDVAVSTTRQPGLFIPSRATFTRPANTTAYEPFDLVANHATAGSVVAMSWTGATLSGAGGSGQIGRVKIAKAGTEAARFRIHFFEIAPTVDNGDGGILVTNNIPFDSLIDVSPEFEIMGGAIKLGGVAGAVGSVWCGINYTLVGTDTIYALLETTSGFSPLSAAGFAVTPELWRHG